MAQTIGERVKKLRETRGWTQEDLAKKLSLGREGFRNKELDKRQFTIPELLDLCDIFGTSLDWLVRGVNTKNVTLHGELGLNDAAVEGLKSFWQEGYADEQDDLNSALSSIPALDAIAQYVGYETDKDKRGYYLKYEKDNSFINCRMSPDLFKAVLGQNLLHELDKLHGTDKEYPYQVVDMFSIIPDYEGGEDSAEEK